MTTDDERTDEERTDEERTDEERTDEERTDEERTDEETEHFPREYVQRLREESGRHRREARDAQAERDRLAGEVWRLRVAATGRLADPDDLPMPDEADADPDEAVTALLERKPHLAARRANGRIGVNEPDTGGAPSLAAMLRAGA